MKRMLFLTLALPLCAAPSWAGEITGTVSAVSDEILTAPSTLGGGVDRISVVVRDATQPDRELTLRYPAGPLGSDTALGLTYKQLLKSVSQGAMMSRMMNMKAHMRCPMMRKMMMDEPMRAMGDKSAAKVSKPAAAAAPDVMTQPCATPKPGDKAAWGMGPQVSFTYDDKTLVIQKTTFLAKQPCCAGMAWSPEMGVPEKGGMDAPDVKIDVVTPQDK